jgi:hypothetical protein
MTGRSVAGPGVEDDVAVQARGRRHERILSSLEALGDEIGIRRSEVEELSEETLTTIRARLDEAALAEAWEQGRTLTIGEAVTLALASEPPRTLPTHRSGASGGR